MAVPAILQLAQAVAAELSAQLPELPSAPTVAVLPVYDLGKTSELRVTVVPRSVEVARATRAADQCDIKIDVGVQKKITTNIEAEVPALMGLVGQVIDALRGRRLSGFPEAAWIGVANDPVYAPEHLREMRQFTSVVTLTYRVLG